LAQWPFGTGALWPLLIIHDQQSEHSFISIVAFLASPTTNSNYNRANTTAPYQTNKPTHKNAKPGRETQWHRTKRINKPYSNAKLDNESVSPLEVTMQNFPGTMRRNIMRSSFLEQLKVKYKFTASE
jgi:hypothetical protein